MILPKHDAGAIDPSELRETPELAQRLLALATDPRALRRKQGDQRQSLADREVGARGCSDFTSGLREEMKAQKKRSDETGLKKLKQVDDDAGCDSAEEEGLTGTKDSSGKSALPSLVTQEEDEHAIWQWPTQHFVSVIIGVISKNKFGTPFVFFHVRWSSGLRFAPNLRMKVS